MNALSHEQESHLHDILQSQLALLEEQTAVHIGHDGRELAVDEVETSPADKATVRLLNDLALGAAGHHAAQVRSLRHALGKFDDGSYGVCEACGGDIGLQRLAARPDARLCIHCQARAERRI